MARFTSALAAVATGLAFASFGPICNVARAADEPVFPIEFNEGVMAPLRTEVPANTRFKLALTNKGKSPAEFESSELRLEKVLAAGSASTLVIRTLDPGEYKFFDDFHPDAPPSVLVAK